MLERAIMRVLNVGGGSKSWTKTPEFLEAFDGYEEVMLDIDPNAGADIVCDAKELHTLEACQFDGIWCSHNLEHFMSTEIGQVLLGMKHVLKPGGKIVVIVPDVTVALTIMMSKGHSLLDEYYAVPTAVEGVELPIYYSDVLWGSHAIMMSGNVFYKHQYGFDEKSLMIWMEWAGFKGSCIRENYTDGVILLNVAYRGIKP